MHCNTAGKNVEKHRSAKAFQQALTNLEIQFGLNCGDSLFDLAEIIADSCSGRLHYRIVYSRHVAIYSGSAYCTGIGHIKHRKIYCFEICEQARSGLWHFQKTISNYIRAVKSHPFRKSLDIIQAEFPDYRFDCTKFFLAAFHPCDCTENIEYLITVDMKHKSIACTGDILKISRYRPAAFVLYVLQGQSFAVVYCKNKIIPDPTPISGYIPGIFWAVHLD